MLTVRKRTMDNDRVNAANRGSSSRRADLHAIACRWTCDSSVQSGVLPGGNDAAGQTFESSRVIGKSASSQAKEHACKFKQLVQYSHASAMYSCTRVCSAFQVPQLGDSRVFGCCASSGPWCTRCSQKHKQSHSGTKASLARFWWTSAVQVKLLSRVPNTMPLLGRPALQEALGARYHADMPAQHDMRCGHSTAQACPLTCWVERD